MNVTDLIARTAQLSPEAIAMRGDRKAFRTFTYAELVAATAHVAERLGALGVAPGDLVGIAMRNTPFHLLVILALARLGAISLPVPLYEPPPRRQKIAQRFGLSAVISGHRDNGVAGFPLLLADSAWSQPPRGYRPQDAAPGDDRPWRVVLTSGTTGVPKGVALTHARSAGLFERYREVLPLGPGDRLLSTRGPDSGFMLRYNLHAFLGGGALVFDNANKPAEFFAAIERHGVTHAIVSPVYLRQLVGGTSAGAQRLPRLAHLSVGGGILSAEVSSLAQAQLTPNVYNNHGSSETGLTALATPDMLRASRDITGRLAPWVEAQAVNEADVVQEGGQAGILRYRSSFFPDAYFKDPEASARSFRGGWFYSGDVGSVDAGLLRVEARSDELINLGGVKISPAEVESVLAAYPGVADAAAFSAATPQGQHRLFAAIVTDSVVRDDELMTHCRSRLGARAPMKIFNLEQLPRNEAGKLLRRELAELVR